MLSNEQLQELATFNAYKCMQLELLLGQHQQTIANLTDALERTKSRLEEAHSAPQPG